MQTTPARPRDYFLAIVAAGAVVALVTGGGVAVANSNYFADILVAKQLEPLDRNDIDRNTSVAVVGTTPVEAATAEIPSNKRKEGTALVLHVTNKDDTNNLCVGDVDFLKASDAGPIIVDGGLFDGGSLNRGDCEHRCNISSLTCDGTAATDGSVILPLAARQFTFQGNRCVCVVGSAASTDFSVDRVIR